MSNTMEQYELLKRIIISIENGDVKIQNRIDGVFIGNKENLFNYVLKQNSVRYVVFKSFLNAIRDIKNDISPVNSKEKDTFLIDLNEKNNDIFNLFPKIECFDYVFFFDGNNKCLFYANDNLEDVTIIIN